MLVLGIDSAGAGCSVALLRDGAVLQTRTELMARGQDARLIPLVQEVMAGEGFDALDRIAVLRGPGSFTGLRIGLAAARGLGVALNKPVIGINRFALYQASLATPQNLLVVLDSRRTELFCQYFSTTPQEPFCATAAELATYDRADCIISGDAASAYPWQHATRQDLPASEAICAARLAAALDPAENPPLPLYLRSPDVSCGPTPPVEEAIW